MGGSGNDLLIDVESIQFQDSDVDLGLRIEIWDWDGDAGNGYDFVDVTGTAGDDDMTNWGSTDEQNSDGDLRGKSGNDVIFGYAGGDRIAGGAGNDFIDGGADGITQNGWTPKDEAFYTGQSKNYTITSYSAGEEVNNIEALETLITQLGLTVDISGYDASQQFIVVEDSIPSSFGGTGTDILTNVEFIAFQDQYLPLAKEEFIDIDPNTGLEVEDL